MLTLSGAHRIYLACGVTDLRKSIDGLAALVQHRFGVSPFEPSLFVFCNLQRDKLKMLYWDHNGASGCSIAFSNVDAFSGLSHPSKR
jgi:transposase